MKQLARNVAVAAVMTVLVAVLTPVSLVHDALSGRRRSGGSVPIPRVSAADTDLRSVLRNRRPVIVEGCAAQLGAPPVDLAWLRAFAAGNDATIRVEFADPARPYYLYTGDYGKTVRRRERCTLDGLLDVLFVEGTGDDVVYQLFGPKGAGGAIGDAIDEVAAAVRSAGDVETVRDASGVWIGSTGVVTPLHHDAWPGLLFQTEGRKSVTMFEPRDRGKLYFNFPLPVGSRWSQLPGRSADADPRRFPRFADARRHEAVLEPGDALYIPTFWAHEMEALTPNISIPLRMKSPASTYLDPGFLRPASEVLDAKARTIRRDLAA